MNGTDLAILLKSICAEIAQGHYDAVDRLFALAETDGGEGLGDLAESFGLMVVQLEVREMLMKSMVGELEEAGLRLREAQGRLAAENNGLRRQMTRLEVQIDQKGREAAVAEIVESNFFVSLQARARAMRQREGG